MRRSRRNPRARPVQKAVLKPAPGGGFWPLVRVGEKGKHTHFLNPDRNELLCASGAHRLKEGVQTFYPAYARDPGTRRIDYTRPAGVTCYRCAKLGAINEAEGRAPWDPGDHR